MKRVNLLFGDDSQIVYERSFQALLLANLVGPMGVGVLSPVLDSLIDPFGTTATNIGLLISVFTAPAIVIIPLAGFLADRYGRKPILLTALPLYGIAGLLIGLTTDFRVALGLRFLQGIAFGGLTPIIITSIGDIYDGNVEATAQGIRFTGSGLSNVMFPFFSGLLVVVSWRYPFFLYALALPIAAGVYLWFNEPVSDDTAHDPSADETPIEQIRSLLQLVRNRKVAAMIIARGLPVFIWIGFITYNSIIVVRILKETPTAAGLILSVASFTLAIAASQAGRITAIFESRLFPLIVSNALLGVGFAIFLLAPGILTGAVGMAISGLGFGLTLSLYRSITTGLATESLRGGLVSLAEAFGRVVGTVTPIIMGGAIAVVAQHTGIGTAVQLVGLSIAVISSIGGVICLTVMRFSPPVEVPD